MRNVDTERTIEVPDRMDEEEDSWDLEGMVAVEEVATSGVRGRLREAQRACEDSGNALPMTIVDVIKLARKGIEAERKNATMFSRQTDLEDELTEMRAARRTMSCQISATEVRLKTLKVQLSETQLELEKLTDELSSTEAELRAIMSVVEKSLRVKKPMSRI